MYVCACVWSLGGREFSDAIPVIKSAIAYRPNADNYCRLSRVRAYNDFAPNGDCFALILMFVHVRAGSRGRW